jgi:hypothetical protein
MSESLRIRVVRSGGVAGMSRRGVLDLPVQEPSGQQDPDWFTMAHQALNQLRSIQEPAPAPEVRDAFIWSLNIDGEDHVVPDRLLVGPARTLAEHVITLRGARS